MKLNMSIRSVESLVFKTLFGKDPQSLNPGADPSTSSTAAVTITIRDVNDEAPTFNQAEYKVRVQENVPFGTPLANLDMEVKDTDTGLNSIFTLRLEDPSGKFSIDPIRATGHSAVSLKINKVRIITIAQAFLDSESSR